MTVERSAEVSVEELVASLVDATLKTEADVQNAVANAAGSELAVLFVHVDWAIMQPQRRRFAEFMVEFQKDHPNNPVMFHYVDCTPVTNGYAPLRSLPGWQELHDAAGGGLIHGCGELVWIQRGRVLHVEQILKFASVCDLVRKTETFMSLEEKGG